MNAQLFLGNGSAVILGNTFRLGTILRVEELALGVFRSFTNLSRDAV